jgi:hypothetical protein
VCFQQGHAATRFTLSVREFFDVAFPGPWNVVILQISLLPAPQSPYLTTPDNSLCGIIKKQNGSAAF